MADKENFYNDLIIINLYQKYQKTFVLVGTEGVFFFNVSFFKILIVHPVLILGTDPNEPLQEWNQGLLGIYLMLILVH